MSYPLYCYCPACPTSKQSGPSFWKHSSCSCSSTITKKAQVGCKGNGEYCKTMDFVKWKWRCSNNQNKAMKVNASYAGAQYIFASRAVAKTPASAYPHGVFSEICEAIADQCMYLYI